jgi:hypothetical protein
MTQWSIQDYSFIPFSCIIAHKPVIITLHITLLAVMEAPPLGGAGEWGHPGMGHDD